MAQCNMCAYPILGEITLTKWYNGFIKQIQFQEFYKGLAKGTVVTTYRRWLFSTLTPTHPAPAPHTVTCSIWGVLF